MAPPLLKVTDLCAGYGRSQVLFGLSLEVPAQGAVCVLGRACLLAALPDRGFG